MSNWPPPEDQIGSYAKTVNRTKQISEWLRDDAATQRRLGRDDFANRLFAAADELDRLATPLPVSPAPAGIETYALLLEGHAPRGLAGENNERAEAFRDAANLIRSYAGGAYGPSTLAAEVRTRASESRRGEPAPAKMRAALEKIVEIDHYPDATIARKALEDDPAPAGEYLCVPVQPGDKQLEVFGYAPGQYMNKCSDCGQPKSDLAKRASSCRECAEKRYQRVILACASPTPPASTQTAERKGSSSTPFALPSRNAPHPSRPLSVNGLGATMADTCERCQGNGEIVVNWGHYLHPKDREQEEKSVRECPDCSGAGTLASPSPQAAKREGT